LSGGRKYSGCFISFVFKPQIRGFKSRWCQLNSSLI